MLVPAFTLFIASQVFSSEQSCTTPVNDNAFALTNYGTIQGRILTSKKGRPFYSYTKIPYAQPPVGENRFRVSST